MGAEQRTLAGAPLRQSLTWLQQALEIPKGRKGFISLAVQNQAGAIGATVGAAVLTNRGWVVTLDVGIDKLAPGESLRTVGKLRIDF